MKALKSIGVVGAIFAVCLMATGAHSDEHALKPGVVAAQQGTEITLQDVDAEAANIPEKDRAGFFDSPKRIESTILNLLQKKELAAQARSEHLDRDPAVKAQIELAVTTALAKAQVDHYRNQLKLPDFETLSQEYYAGHKDDFVEKGRITVEHVLVGTKDSGRSDADARALAEKIEAQAKAHPDQFDALVEKYSDDPSKTKNHGRIEDASSGRLAAPFAEAAQRLRTPGEISPPVKTNFGYHILKLIDHAPDKQMPFAEVHTRIVAQLKKNFIDAQMEQYVNDFRGKPLQANPDLVASLRTRYAPPGYVSPADIGTQNAAQDAAPAKEQH